LHFPLKIITATAFAMFWLGAPSEALSQDRTQAVEVYQWYHHSTGGIFGIGEGWEIEIIPAKYITVIENKIVSNNRPPYSVIPARLEWIRDDSVGPDTDPGTQIKLEIIPATYRTVIETEIIEEEKFEYQIIAPVYNEDGTLKKPAFIQESIFPAVTKQIEKQVVDTPQYTVEHIIPLEHRIGYRQIIKIPETELHLENVSRFSWKQIPRIVPSHCAKFHIRNPIGEITDTFNSYEELTAFVERFKPR